MSSPYPDTTGQYPQAGYPVQNGAAPPATDAPGPSRRDDELARKDRTLAEFMLMLDDYEPLVSKRHHLVHTARHSVVTMKPFNRSLMKSQTTICNESASNATMFDCVSRLDPASFELSPDSPAPFQKTAAVLGCTEICLGYRRRCVSARSYTDKYLLGRASQGRQRQGWWGHRLGENGMNNSAPLLYKVGHH